MARDFLLIKGYPGTGKTTTIATLIAILVRLGKKVLFTSFTNSAVDNLLIKVATDFADSIDFVRIGSYDRVHPSLQQYESSFMTRHIENTQQLDEFYKKKVIYQLLPLRRSQRLTTYMSNVCVCVSATDSYNVLEHWPRRFRQDRVRLLHSGRGQPGPAHHVSRPALLQPQVHSRRRLGAAAAHHQEQGRQVSSTYYFVSYSSTCFHLHESHKDSSAWT